MAPAGPAGVSAMSLVFDITKSVTAPPSLVTGRAELAQMQPFTITCIGEVQRSEDDPALGTWWQQETQTLGRCSSLGEAVILANDLAQRGGHLHVAADASGFSPRLLVILDGDACLVLAGEIQGASVDWCQPVADRAEARKVVEAASCMRAEASDQTIRDNFSAARELRHQASLLEGRLVDPFWREDVRRLLAGEG